MAVAPARAHRAKRGLRAGQPPAAGGVLGADRRGDLGARVAPGGPPGWIRPLAAAAGAAGASALTARNLGAAARAWLAERNPDLLASHEGGANALLVRPPWRIAEVRRLTLTRRPERRRLLWARLAGPQGASLCVGNLHASTHPPAAAREVERAAEQALAWAGASPLLFGGDLNLRPAADPQAFERLRARLGLAPPTDPQAIDHLLAHGAAVVEPPRRLAPAWRDVDEGVAAGGATPAGTAASGQRVRLSDHDAVAGRFRV